MALTLRTFLLLVAVILFLVAGLGIGAGRLSLTNIGLACFAAAFLVP